MKQVQGNKDGDHNTWGQDHGELEDEAESRLVHPVAHGNERRQEDQGEAHKVPGYQDSGTDSLSQQQPTHSKGGEAEEEVWYPDPEYETGRDFTSNPFDDSA